MKSRHIPLLSALASALLMGGCANTLHSRNQSDFDAITKALDARMLQMKQEAEHAELKRQRAQDVARPYILGNSIPLAREAKMPPQLRASVPITALFAKGSVDLQTATDQLSISSGLRITATPDALLSPGMFAPKISNQGNPVTAPPKVTLTAKNAPIWQVLDEVAAQIQASWRPTASGAEFYRVVTKTYELMTIPTTTGTTASLGKSGGGSDAFTSSAKTTFTLKDASNLDAVQKAVETLTSIGGKFVLTSENQTLTLTDTPAVHAQVEEYVKAQNKMMSRRVRMVVEAIEVVNKEGHEGGLDWSLVYNTATNALTGGSSGGLPASSQSAKFTGTQMIGPMAGSSMVIRALSEVGQVVNRRVFPFVTTSGRPITQALRTTFNYVDQVQTTSVSSSSTVAAQAPTVTQKDETVGTFLTLVPTAKPDGSVFMAVSFDVTTADPLRPYTVGSGASAITVQQKTINGSGVIQEVPVRSGRTEVIGGIELLTTNNTNRRLAEDMPLITGGYNQSTKSKSVTILLVTAVVEEGV